jgi:hypothetical protein
VDPFAYTTSPLPVRADLIAANRKTWQRIAEPGAWWTGAERVAIAAAARAAHGCALCRERKQALSPNAVRGTHDGTDARLAPAATDAVHRIVTDQSRLSRDWVEGLAAEGVSDGHYVELVGVVVSVVCIDAFHRALGLAPEPLPQPLAGAPSGYRPPGLDEDAAWVAMIDPAAISAADRDLFPPAPQVPNVLRAMSLVPDAVRSLHEQSGAYYLEMVDVVNPKVNGGRALTRPQMELVAGRVSALNECFY